MRPLAGLLGAVRCGGASELAAQGVGVVRGLDAGQLDACVAGDHAGKLHHLGRFKAQGGAGVELFAAGGGAAFDLQVGAKKLAGAQQHAVIQAGTEIANGGAGSDGNQQRGEQGAQFAGAGIAQQLAAC